MINDAVNPILLSYAVARIVFTRGREVVTHLSCCECRACANFDRKRSGTSGGVVAFAVESVISGDSGLVEGVATMVVNIDLTKRQNEPKLGWRERNFLHLMELADESGIV